MKFGYLTLGVALLATLPAYAHEPKASHGGRIADAGPYHRGTRRERYGD